MIWESSIRHRESYLHREIDASENDIHYSSLKADEPHYPFSGE